MKRLKWVVEFEVDPLWVEDGFNLNDKQALEMLSNRLPYAYVDAELGARVLKGPSAEVIRKIQGGIE